MTEVSKEIAEAVWKAADGGKTATQTVTIAGVSQTTVSRLIRARNRIEEGLGDSEIVKKTDWAVRRVAQVRQWLIDYRASRSQEQEPSLEHEEGRARSEDVSEGRSEGRPSTTPRSDQQRDPKDDPLRLPVLQKYQSQHIDDLFAFGQSLRDRIKMPDPIDYTFWSQGGVSTATLWQRFGQAPDGTFPEALIQHPLFDSFQEHLSGSNWLVPLEESKKVLPTYAKQLEAVIAEVSINVGRVFQTNFVERQLVARAAFMTQWNPRLELVEGNVRVQPVNQEWEVIFFSSFISRQTKTEAEALQNQLLTVVQNLPQIQGLSQLRELDIQVTNLLCAFQSGLSDTFLRRLLISTTCRTLCI